VRLTHCLRRQAALITPSISLLGLTGQTVSGTRLHRHSHGSDAELRRAILLVRDAADVDTGLRCRVGVVGCPDPREDAREVIHRLALRNGLRAAIHVMEEVRRPSVRAGSDFDFQLHGAAWAEGGRPERCEACGVVAHEKAQRRACRAAGPRNLEGDRLLAGRLADGGEEDRVPARAGTGGGRLDRIPKRRGERAAGRVRELVAERGPRESRAVVNRDRRRMPGA
jgi:hypothetical protein